VRFGTIGACASRRGSSRSPLNWNQKRHGLTPLDLARFIKNRVGGGESNATVAKRLGMNLTTLARHLSLLELPPVLGQSLKAGRCISPRTLHELSVSTPTEF
jgi:ParB family chromosome partitioning protein